VVPPTEPGKRHPAGWAIALILVLIAIGLAYYLMTQSAVKTAGAPVISVPVVSVSVADLNRTVRVTGTIAARNFFSLMAPRILGSRNNTNRGGMGGFGLAGPPPGGGAGPDFNLVLLHLAKAGSRVKKGEVVAQFDSTNQLLRLDDYKDAVIQLDNSIRKMIANLAANKEAHDQTVRAAKAAWDQAKLDLAKAPVQSVIDAENAKLTAEANEATYKQLVFEDSLVIEQQAATIRVSELTKSQTDIELQRAEGNVKKMEVESPMDGIVVMGSIIRNGEYGQVREGDQIYAGQPFLTIVDPSSMVLNAIVNQVDAGSLRLGMKAMIHLDAYPDLTLTGVVEGIGAMAKTSTFRASYVSSIPVRIRIDRTDARVIPDLTGSADVILGGEANTLVVPRAAVLEEEGASFVFVQSPQGWTKKQVELGLSNFLQVAVHSGLQKGEVVALTRPI
jgi:multidrug efflux pump subunit AcrA (membrane-fusion protein)